VAYSCVDNFIFLNLMIKKISPQLESCNYVFVDRRMIGVNIYIELCR